MMRKNLGIVTLVMSISFNNWMSVIGTDTDLNTNIYIVDQGFDCSLILFGE